MILYSIIPAEVVFQGSTYMEELKYIQADYRGERILVAQLTDKSYSIARLLSTRPGSFLDPALQPGNVVDARELKIMTGAVQ